MQVSSQEAQLKGEAADFTFDSPAIVSRFQCRMVTPYGPHGSNGSAYPSPTPLVDGYPAYRHNSLSHYQYPLKLYQQFGDYADENVDFGMHNSSSYHMMNPEHLSALPSGSIYSTSAPSRGWAAQTPQIPKHNPFFEPDSAYTHTQYQATFPLRPAPHHESKQGISLTGMANALPTPSAGSDRPVLPYPSAGRPLLRSSESMGALQGPSSSRGLDHHPSYSNDGLLRADLMGAKSLNNSVTENASLSSSYLPLTTASELPATQMSYNQSQNDIYTPPSVDSGSLFSVSIASNIDGNRSSEYLPSSASSKRPSLSNSNDRTGSVSEYSPKLSSGQHYEPHINPNSYFPPPPHMTPRTPTLEMAPQRRLSGIQAS
jgi:hypothetical protein